MRRYERLETELAQHGSDRGTALTAIMAALEEHHWREMQCMLLARRSPASTGTEPIKPHTTAELLQNALATSVARWDQRALEAYQAGRFYEAGVHTKQALAARAVLGILAEEIPLWSFECREATDKALSQQLAQRPPGAGGPPANAA